MVLSKARLFPLRAFIKQAFYLLLKPLKRFSYKIVTHLPNKKFHFRPLFLCEIYMALNLWEPYVSRVFTPKSGDIVLDAGAHIGYHTLKAANKVGSKGKVVAVEPDYRNTTVLRYNIKRKNAENITLIDCALGDHVGYATFKLAENPLVSQLAANGITVKMMTVDVLCAKLRIQQLDWLKVDVEKSALSVLKGATAMLKRGTTIIVEDHDNQAVNFLSNHGYDVTLLTQSPFKAKCHLATRSR